MILNPEKMKNTSSLHLLIPFLLISSFLFAQVPQGIPYQAMIRNSDGSALMNTNVTVRFTLHQNTTTGAVEYQETQALVTNAFGLINAVFGQGTAVQGTFAAINWSNAAKFIQVEANDGNGYVDMGTKPMLSVSYANYVDLSLSSQNGIHSISVSGDSLILENGIKIIVPSISQSNLKFGCTDPNACNYSSQANSNDGTCMYIGSSCNDQMNQTILDSISSSCQCVGKRIGCLDVSACNYSPSAEISDSSCLYLNTPCDDHQINTVNEIVDDNCNCIGILLGCLNPQACNYNELALLDDGSCLFQNDTCDDGYVNFALEIINSECKCVANYCGECIGTYFEGGRIGYIFGPSDIGYVPNEIHGLIISEQSIGLHEWGCAGLSIDGADEVAFGSGYQNTLDILASCSSESAASICWNYSNDGKDDWFLPSKGDLMQIFTSLYTSPEGYNFSMYLQQIGCFWSSSEFGCGNAWRCYPWIDSYWNVAKTYLLPVFPIRKF